jgi:gliding motility-associated-like protein
MNCNGNIGSGLWGTPDFYHACGVFHPSYNPIPPNTALGFCNTHSGGGMMGLVCYNTPYPNYREYLSANLLCTLQPGNTYTVSFWINTATNPHVKYNTSHFGVYLSGTMPPQIGYNPILVTPQYEITTIVSNTTWTQHSFTINPTTPLSWITLGCFKTDASINVNLATPSAGNPYSNYYVDDISVIGNTTIPSNFSVQNVSCNSFNNGSATITPLSPGSYTYNWQPGSMNTPSAANLSVGIYTVTLSNNCGSDTKTVSITQQPSPTLSISSVTSCPNSQINFTANALGGTPGYSYTWSQGVSTSSIVGINASPGIISCTVTDSQGCKATASSAIGIGSITSNFNFTVNACENSLTTTNTSIGAGSYQWYFGDGNTSTLTSPNHTFSASGNYTISLVAFSSSGCKDSIAQIINFSNTNVTGFTFSASSCGSNLTFNNTSTGSSAYLWNFGDGFTSTLQNPSHNYSALGNYIVSLISNPGTKCADTVYNTVNINSNPAAAGFIYTTDICSGTVTFTNTSMNANSYQWYFDGTNTSTEINPTFNFTPGTHTVTLIAEPGSTCSNSVVAIITISENPVHADFIYENPSYTNDIFLSNLSYNASSYEWSFSDGTGSTLFEPSHTYEMMGVFTICLKATNHLGCTDVICKEIKVDPDWTLYVPNTFTPNEDGLNDMFFAKGTNIRNFQMEIFDRWGEKIFASDDIMKGWDGTYKSQNVTQDAFTWKITFVDCYSKAHEKTGHVTVIK